MQRRAHCLFALAAMTFAAAASAASPTWLDDPGSFALDSPATPVVALFYNPAPKTEVSALATLLSLNPAFQGASAPYTLIIADVKGSRFDLPSGAPRAVILAPGGSRRFTYPQMVSVAALVKDMRTLSAEMEISAAVSRMQDGDDAAAVKRLLDLIASRPPMAAEASARFALSSIEERGVALVIAADEMTARREYLAADAALRKISSDYAGTDAAVIAQARLQELASDPRAVDIFKRQALSSEADALLAQAAKADEEGHFADAVALYKRILADFSVTTAAATAGTLLGDVRKKAGEKARAETAKMQQECQLWMTIADNLAHQREFTRAKAYYQKIIDNYSGSRYAKEAREKIKRITLP